MSWRIGLSIAAALALTACEGETADGIPPTAAVPLDAGWQKLADGSFFRLAGNPRDPDRREADRCWPANGRFDCLGIDDINLPVGRIVVANRTHVEALPATISASARTGFSCAIYDGGVVEQRVIGGDAGLLTNDSLDDDLWSRSEAEKLTRAGEGRPEGGFVDCAALTAALGGEEGLATLKTAGFDRGDVLPPLGAPLAPAAS